MPHTMSLVVDHLHNEHRLTDTSTELGNLASSLEGGEKIDNLQTRTKL